MKRFRLTIAGILAAVVVAALLVVGLARPAPIWAALISLATSTVLLASVLAAWMGRNRAFWRGFAVFGCGLVLLEWIWAGPGSERLADLISARIFPIVHPAPGEPSGSVGTWRAENATGGMTTLPPPPAFTDSRLREVLPPLSEPQTPLFDSFTTVSRCAATLLFALAGGLLAVVIARRGREGDDSRAGTSPP